MLIFNKTKGLISPLISAQYSNVAIILADGVLYTRTNKSNSFKQKKTESFAYWHNQYSNSVIS